MADNAVGKSPRGGDERRKPSGGKRPARRGEKRGSASTPTNHPYKVPSVTVSQSATGGRGDGPKPGAADQRESLFNSGAVGTFHEVMVGHHEVTLLRGILIEIDGECLRVGDIIEAMPADGFDLYERYVCAWLDNHPTLRKAEVRFSGRWLHCILWFETPVKIESDRRRELWDAVAEAVQRSLPSDPAAPSLLAMTRPVGSVNSKTGRTVELIRTGQPVTEQEVLNFADDLTRRGFATVTQILFGTSTVSPCPFCREEESVLSAAAPRYGTSDPKITNRGSCYHCGRVTLKELITLVLKGREDERAPKEGDSNIAAKPATESTSDELRNDDCPFPVPAESQGGNR